MVKFYDPKNEADQARVEALLKAAAIEYFLAPEGGNGACREIEVAEEDVPKAEEVLLRGGS